MERELFTPTVDTFCVVVLFLSFSKITLVVTLFETMGSGSSKFKEASL